MSDVLSQSQIDTLLSALSCEDIEIEEKILKEDEKLKVKTYNFKSPQKFSKDHIRTLEKIYDNFARFATNYLSGRLRQNVRVKLECVEQISYEEFIHSIPTPTIMTFFNMTPLQGTLFMEIKSKLAVQIIEILLGGSPSKKIPTKDFTQIEKNILSKVIKELIKNFEAAWNDITAVNVQFNSLETNANTNQILASSEPIALITFTIDIGGNSTFMNLCLPYISVEKILDKLVIEYWSKASDINEIEDSKEMIKSRVEQAEVSVNATLGKMELTVKEFLDLQEGDTLKLNNKHTNPINIDIENHTCFLGKPGVKGRNYGVEILDIAIGRVNTNGK